MQESRIVPDTTFAPRPMPRSFMAFSQVMPRWGSHDLPPQAGLGVYERSPDGLLAAACVYDDVEAPLGHP